MRITLWNLIRNYSFALCWGIFLILMGIDHLQDPYNPNEIGIPAYGHNNEGALLQGFILTLVELAVLYLIIRPWSFRRSWLRVISAMVLFLPWTFLMIFMTMHSGGIFFLHFLWLLVIDLILISLLFWTLLKIILSQLRVQ